MELLEAYKHCIYCGGEVSVKINKITCNSCKRIRFINASPAVTGLILQDNKLLLVKRAEEPSKERWDLPGGFVDLNENFEDGLKREMMEELGVKIKSVKYFNSVIERYLYKDVNEYVLVINFIVKPESYDVVPSDDASDAKYFDLHDALNQDLAFPTVEQVIKDLIKFKEDS